MNNAQRKEAITEIKQELFSGWKIIFVIQLIVGGHAIYELADKYPDMGLIYYSVMLIFGAALMATVLLVILAVLFTIIGAIFVGFSVWMERRRERKNDAD